MSHCSHSTSWFARGVSMSVAAFAAFVSLPMSARAQGSGPDVIGVRVGMTHPEALAVLRAKAPKENWTTLSTSLQFQDSKQAWQSAPNGTFRAALMTKNQAQKDPKLERYTAIFSPTPGKERVVAMARTQIYGQDRPLLKDLVAQMIEKYGKPNEALYDSQFIWAFDSEGRPRPLRQDQSGAPCRHVRQVGDQPHEAEGWSFDYKPIGTSNRKPVALTEACGAYMVRARVTATNQGFVQGYTVEVIGHELATSGMVEAARVIAEAQAGELSGEREAASKRAKPTF